MKQLITPTPIIPAVAGWCLQYVRQAFGLPARYASATEAWQMSKSQHRDRNFPAGKWVPVWYDIDVEPLGHVVILAPDGRVYSTSDYSGWPVIHNSLADLEAYYAYYGMGLIYRGWTEDVAGYAVLQSEAVTPQSTTTAKEEELMSASQYEDLRRILVETQARATLARDNSALAVRIATENQRRIGAVKDMVADLSKKVGVAIDYDKIDRLFEENVAEGLDVNITFGPGPAAPVAEIQK